MRIEGTVKDAVTGKPIADATLAVSIGGHEVARLRTDVDGQFDFATNEDCIGQTLACASERLGYEGARAEAVIQQDPTALALVLTPIEKPAPRPLQKPAPPPWLRWVAISGAVALAVGIGILLLTTQCGPKKKTTTLTPLTLPTERIVPAGPAAKPAPTFVTTIPATTASKPAATAAATTTVTTPSAAAPVTARSDFEKAPEVEIRQPEPPDKHREPGEIVMPPNTNEEARP